MDKPGKLRNIFEDLNSESSDPRLDWENMGPDIMDAVKKKRRRRFVIWWWLGGAGVIALLILASNLLDPIFPTMRKGNDEVDKMSLLEKGEDKEETIVQSLATLENEGIIRISQDDASEPSLQDNRNESEGGQNMGVTKNPIDIEALNFQKVSKISGTAVEKEEEGRSVIVSGESNSLGLELASDIIYQEDSRIEPSSYVDLGGAKDGKEVAGAPERLEKNEIIMQIPMLSLGLKEEFPEYDMPPLTPRKADKEFTLSGLLWLGVSTANFGEDLLFSNGVVDFSGELSLKYKRASAWFITAGISLADHQFRTSFNQSQNVMLYRPGTVDTIFRYSTGDETVIYKDSIPGIRTRNFGHTSRIRNIGIPVHLGFEFSKGNTSISPEAGLVFSVAKTIDARIVDSNYEYRDYDLSQYVNFSVALRAGIGLSRKTRIGGISARYLWSLSPSTELSDRSIGRFQAYSVQLGYRYDF